MVVELNEDHYGEIIRNTLRVYNRWNPIQVITAIPASRDTKRYQLSSGDGEDFAGITGVYRVDPNVVSILNNDYENPFTLTRNRVYLSQVGGYGADFALYTQMSEILEKVYSSTFTWDHRVENGEHYVYADNLPNESNSLAVTWFKNRTVADIEPNDEDWVIDYAIAKAKEILGSIRGKFSQVPAGNTSIDLGGRELRQDGLDRIKELVEELQLRHPINFVTFG